jgi:hypothetical protein
VPFVRADFSPISPAHFFAPVKPYGFLLRGVFPDKSGHILTLRKMLTHFSFRHVPLRSSRRCAASSATPLMLQKALFRKQLHRLRRDLFAYQRTDDFRGGSVVGGGFDVQPSGGKVVYHDNVVFVFHEEAVFPVTGHFRRVLCYFFFQRPCFFFGHSCHWFLLLLEQMIIDAPAFHRMKYVNNALVNIIIHNFEQITVPVIPDQQMFVEYSIPQFIISGMVDGMANILFADPMFESRFVVLNEDFYHTPILPQKRRGDN